MNLTRYDLIKKRNYYILRSNVQIWAKFSQMRRSDRKSSDQIISKYLILGEENKSIYCSPKDFCERRLIFKFFFDIAQNLRERK